MCRHVFDNIGHDINRVSRDAANSGKFQLRSVTMKIRKDGFSTLFLNHKFRNHKLLMNWKNFSHGAHCNFLRYHFQPFSLNLVLPSVVKPSGAIAKRGTRHLTWQPRVTQLNGRQAWCRLLLGARSGAPRSKRHQAWRQPSEAIAERGTRHYTKTWYTVRGLLMI